MLEKHFTATAYIVDDNRALLHFHHKLQKWLPPGGHVEENELPSEAAIREALEETGLEVEILLQENIWVQAHNASSFPRPYLCLLENIPAYKDKPAHQHMDFIYVCRQIGGKLLEEEVAKGLLRWFDKEQIENLREEEEIFGETKKTLYHLLEKHGS